MFVRGMSRDDDRGVWRFVCSVLTRACGHRVVPSHDTIALSRGVFGEDWNIGRRLVVFLYCVVGTLDCLTCAPTKAHPKRRLIDHLTKKVETACVLCCALP